MKTIVLSILAIAGIALFGGCTTVEQTRPAARTTTTTEHTMRRQQPAAAVYETSTIRSY